MKQGDFVAVKSETMSSIDQPRIGAVQGQGTAGKKEENNSSRDNMKIMPLPTPEVKDVQHGIPSDVAGVERADSPTDSSASLAVDCPAAPAEVIVQAHNNIRKIRMKFTPRPPENDRPGSVKRGSVTLQRLSSTGSTVWSSQGSLQDCNDEQLPLAQQETARDQPSSLPPHFTLGPLQEEGSVSSLPPVQSSTTRALASRETPQSRDLNDHRVLEDMQAGLLYFTTRSRELKELTNLNQQLIQTVSTLEERNEQLEKDKIKLQSLVDKLELQLEDARGEMDELKIKLDEAEKENGLLQDQTMSQWRSRMKIEEMYTELCKSTTEEAKVLQAQLQERQQQLDSLKRQQTENGAIPTRSSLVSHSADLQLMDRISRLEEQLKRSQVERETASHRQAALQEDKTELQRHLDKANVEVETQTRRFLSLRKNFNDLMEEHDKLRAQLRGRRNSVGASATWPLGIQVKDPPPKDEGRAKLNHGKDSPDGKQAASDHETVTRIDIPVTGHTYAKSRSPSKRSHSKQRHVRQKSNGSPLSDSSTLPPVHNHR